MPESDEELMTAVAAGRDDAFRELVRRYEAKARRYCRRIFHDGQIAEDVAQDVFLKLYRNADRYEPTGRFHTYFYRVLANLCFDRLRFEKRRAVVRGVPTDGTSLDGYEDGRAGLPGPARFPGPDEALIGKERREAVRAAVDGLPDRLKAALVLREFDGLSYKEVAEAMETTLNEVKVLIHRARKQLAKRLAKTLAGERRP